MPVEYNNQHWEELITTIISRIGADAFLRLSAAVLREYNTDMADEIKVLADAYTRSSEETEWIAQDKEEWRHEAAAWQRLKR